MRLEAFFNYNWRKIMVKFVRKFKQQPIDRKPGETPVQAAFRKLAENTKYFNEVIKPHLEQLVSCYPDKYIFLYYHDKCMIFDGNYYVKNREFRSISDNEIYDKIGQILATI
jgi:hypothetical protein